jgi:hypothetical protein
MQILALPLCTHYAWCGHALFYADVYGVWRVQMPRCKPVKLAAAPTSLYFDLVANDQFVCMYVRFRDTPLLLLFARDGTLLHDAPLHRSNCQLTGSGLAVYDRHTNTVTTWPGGQSHAVDSDVQGLSVRSTNLATPVFHTDNEYGYMGGYLTYVDGKVVPLHGEEWKWVDPGCPAYRVNGHGIYVRAGYRAGLLALWRSGLPLALRWHIMTY